MCSLWGRGLHVHLVWLPLLPLLCSVRARALIRSRCCAASNELLTQPIVACELGNLFNKEAVLTALLERTLNPAFAHIRSTWGLLGSGQLDRRCGGAEVLI